jgi:hypothetical protein
VLGAAAELERALIRERSLAGLKAAVAKGKVPGNPGLRRRDPGALEKARRGRETARDDPVIAHAQDFLPTVEALRPAAPWDQVVRVLKGAGKSRPWDRKPWTPNSLIRAVRRLAAAGLIRSEVSLVGTRHHAGGPRPPAPGDGPADPTRRPAVEPVVGEILA